MKKFLKRQMLIYEKNFSVEYEGKMWSSIKNCCKSLGISYNSVINYKSKNKCTSQEAIKYYHDLLSKKRFVFGNRPWNSLETCCNYYDFNINSLKNYMYYNHCTVQDALSHYLSVKKNKIYIYQNKRYKSFADCCHHFDIDPSTVRAYSYRCGISLGRAINKCISLRQSRKFIFRGIEYERFVDCCKVYYFSPDYIEYYSRRYSIPLDTAFSEYLEKVEKNIPDYPKLVKNHFRDVDLSECKYIDLKSILFKNKIYPTMAFFCKKNNINLSAFYNYLFRKQCSFYDAAVFFLNNKETSTS